MAGQRIEAANVSAELDQVLISHIIANRSLNEVLSAGITSKFFVGERWPKVWRWVTDYAVKHGEVPSEAAYRRNFPTYKLVDVDEPLSGLIAEMMIRRRERIVQDGLQAAVNAFDERSDMHDDERIQQTLELIVGISRDVVTDIATNDIVNYTDVVGSAITRLLNMKPTSLLGIPSGFPTIDEATGGFQSEQLVTIVALPKRGKTSIALVAGMEARRGGWNVDMFSFEMANSELLERSISLGAQVGLTDLQRGRLSPDEIDRVYAYEAEQSEFDGELRLVHDISRITTVGAVDAHIERTQPDLVIIDGGYMMQDENGEKPGSPQALTNITRGLKRVAQRRRVPILLTTQGLESRTTKTKGIEMGSIGYSSSFAQDSDVILGLDRDDLMMPIAKLKVVAARNALGVETTISLNYAIGVVEETNAVGPRIETKFKQRDRRDDDID